MDIKKIIYVLRALGIRGIFRLFMYSIQRDRINRKFSHAPDDSNGVEPGNLQSVASQMSGIKVDFDNACVEVISLAPGFFKVSWGPGKQTYPYTLEKLNWDVQNVIRDMKDGTSILSTENMQISIGKSGTIRFRDKQLNEIRYDNPPIRYGEGWKLSTRLAPEEHIYGLGERTAPLNLRPGKYTSWNTDPGGNYSSMADPIYIGTPIYLSLSSQGSYLVYFENSYKSRYVIGDNLEATFDGGTLTYYTIFGSLETIFEQLANLVGHPLLPPRWSLGYHQSRWGYRSEDEIRKLVDGFVAHDLPISVIHLDIDYMDGFRVFTIHPDRFPDMKRLTKELDAKGIKVVATINPAIKQDPKYKIYADGRNKDMYCKLPNGKVLGGVSWPGWSVFPDFTDAEVRKWWAEQYQYLVDAGISGFWHDMNEPASMAVWGDMSFPEVIQHDMEGHGGDHREAHNLYGLLMNRAGHEALTGLAPDKRPWIFSRSGWAGLQRYAWNWTGDVESSWEALRQTIPTILGLGLSGHAFSGVDIGGYSGDPDAELYLRWFQMATFFPLFRTHSATGTRPREPWSYGEPTTSIIRKFLKLRYSLIPYFYTLSWKTSQSGIPPVRPLFWEAPNDPQLWDIGDEFMFGNSMLVAPILYKGAASRPVTLPPGVWYSFWDDRILAGPGTYSIEATSEVIPIFIRGGSILPLEENKQLVLHIHIGDGLSSSSELYLDSGDGYGVHRVDTFKVSNQQGSCNINWDKNGDYPFPYRSVKIILHGKKLAHTTADGVSISMAGNSIDVPIFQNLTLTYG